MLPQMMPLPWFSLFIFLFLFFYLLLFYLSYVFFMFLSDSKMLKSRCFVFVW